MSHHIAAEKGQIAERVILPGDPLRAKFIAENFLENVKCYTDIRNMLGFTGTYKGKEVSVQGTGMGMPSMGIYAHELICDYGCKRLIRTGTCGSLSPERFDIKDVIIAQAAATDSGTRFTRFGNSLSIPAVASFELVKDAYENAKKMGINAKVGTVCSEDLFYDEDPAKNDILKKFGISCIEMECAELFTLGLEYDVQTLGIITVSDLILEDKGATAKERETSFTQMMKLALETI